MSASKNALQLTTQTIDRRAFHFRNLVILLVVIVLGCLIAALVQWSWRPLVGWLAVMPLCGAFLVFDNYLVGRWQRQMLKLWADGALHVEDFAQSILALRLLPGATLRGMLALLPSTGDGPSMDRLPATTRDYVARLYGCFHQGARDYSAAFALAYSVSVIGIAWALFAWDSRPLLGCLAIVAAFAVGRSLNAMRLRHCREIVEQARAEGIDLHELAGNLAASPGHYV